MKHKWVVIIAVPLAEMGHLVIQTPDWDPQDVKCLHCGAREEYSQAECPGPAASRPEPKAPEEL